MDVDQAPFVTMIVFLWDTTIYLLKMQKEFVWETS